MNTRFFLPRSALCCLLGLLAIGKANAATMTVSCSVTGTTRSSITIAVAGISGSNYALVASGHTGYKTAYKGTKPGGTQVFRFDSSPAATALGATYVPPTFIKNLWVAAYIRKAYTHQWVGGLAGICTKK